MSDNIYEDWLEASDKLKQAKADELALRNHIIDLHQGDTIEGARTDRFEGFKIVTTAKLNRSIDVAVLDAIWEDLPDDQKECVDFKPSLKLSKYKEVEKAGGMLLQAITTKPAQASLKVTHDGDYLL